LDIAQQGATNGQVLKWNGTTWAPAADNNTTYTAGSGISISGTTISATDASATNEIQTLSLSGTTLTLSNGGGSVTLPTGADNWGTQVVQSDATLSGDGSSTYPLTLAQQGAMVGEVLKWNGSTWLPEGDKDNQTLFLSGTTLTISSGNSLDLTPVLNNAWQIGGNSGTNPSSHFIGTTDNQPLNFRANNEKAGRIGLNNDGSTFLGYQAGNNDDLSNNRNTFIGYQSGLNTTNAEENVGVGYQALYTNTTGLNNTVVGSRALYFNTTGSHNTAIGRRALYTNTIGTDNMANGSFALYSNTSGSENSAGGAFALYSNTTGSGNTAIGLKSLYFNTTGKSNVAIGIGALYSNTDRSSLVAVGDSALYNNGIGAMIASEAIDNTALGSRALFSNTYGSWNTASGKQALYSNVSGSSNTAHGWKALYSNTTGGNNSAVGSEALYNNTSGQENTACGNQALRYNTTGSGNVAYGSSALRLNNLGSNNVAVGNNALYYNALGSNNVAIGYYSLYANTDRNGLVAVGDSALRLNGFGAINPWDAVNNTALGSASLCFNTVGSYNTASGDRTLYSNVSGSYNTANGVMALYSNTNGSWNTASGSIALHNNTTGSGNTASGAEALLHNTTGSNNTASGAGALYNNTIGAFNTACGFEAGSNTFSSIRCSFFGYDADQWNSTSYINSTALGSQSLITASNQVRVGNNSVTSIGGYANWTNVSDGRYKKDVQENVPGLDFILRLRPVTYHLDVTGIARFLGEGEFRPKREGREEPQVDETTLALERQSRAEKEKILYTGFIAQEVEKTARELGYDFSGVDKPQNEHSLYGLRYAEFVVPLVKAMQEQQRIIDEQRRELEAQKQINLSFSQQIDQLKTEMDLLKARYLSENR
jgi:hypothetical protein